MTAQTTPRAPKQWGTEPVAAHFGPMPVAAAIKVWCGAMVFLLATGYVSDEPAHNAVCLGVAEETVDNLLGSAGAKSLTPARGTPAMVNSAGVDALTSADIGRRVYAVDDQTVARTSGGGTRCVAGRLVAIEDGWCFVEVGVDPDPAAAIDEYFLAGADLSTSLHLAVKHSTSVTDTVVLAGAGEMVLGILQNAPTNGAVARVRVFGRSKWVGGASVGRGLPLAADAAGKAKQAVAGIVNTNDAGSTTDAILGSYVAGISRGPLASDVEGDVFINAMGTIPTTAS